MAIIKCKMCGGDIQLAEDKTFGTCEYCGSTMTLPKVSDDQRAAAFNRGNHFRRIGEFDKALAVYERIVAEDDNDAEAHWCCALCRFGIEYVEDPATFEWLPTCHRASFDSFLEDVDYIAALEHSDGITRRQYQKDAAKIAEVQRGILATSQNTEPYDVFISYKELDADGNRTRDSILAQELYYRLTEKGWRVFFSRISLEDVPGTQYEPYIFAALNSAKVMIVVGTSAENLNAVWVKNEWSRYLSLMRKDRSKLLIPCYRDMDPYDLPEQLSVLMSYDMGKIGFIQDLIRGVDKVLSAEKPKETKKEAVVVPQNGGANIAPLLERAFMFLEDGDWKSADEYCEKVLDLDPKNAKAYVGKLMSELHVRKEGDLVEEKLPFDDKSNYQKAVRFADATLKDELTGYVKSIKERNENNRLDGLYHDAVYKMNSAKNEAAYREAAKLFSAITEWKDSKKLADSCYERAEACRKNDVYARAKQLMMLSSETSIKHAATLFASIPGWKDADELINQCPDLAEAAKKNKLYGEAIIDGRRISVDSLERAISKLKSLGDWKDAPAKIVEYELRLEEAKKLLAEAAAERERIAAEAKQREALYREYLNKYPEKRNESKYKQDLSAIKAQIAQHQKSRPSVFILLILVAASLLLGRGLIWLVINNVLEGVKALSVIGIILLLFLLWKIISKNLTWSAKNRKLNAEERAILQKLKLIDSYPQFVDPFPQKPASAATGDGNTTPESEKVDPVIIKLVIAEMANLDDMDKRAYINEALVDDRITDEEYYRIMEILSL